VCIGGNRILNKWEAAVRAFQDEQGVSLALSAGPEGSSVRDYLDNPFIPIRDRTGAGVRITWSASFDKAGSLTVNEVSLETTGGPIGNLLDFHNTEHSYYAY
jgi:hypothetical protein